MLFDLGKSQTVCHPTMPNQQVRKHPRAPRPSWRELANDGLRLALAFRNGEPIDAFGIPEAIVAALAKVGRLYQLEDALNRGRPPEHREPLRAYLRQEVTKARAKPAVHEQKTPPRKTPFPPPRPQPVRKPSFYET